MACVVEYVQYSMSDIHHPLLLLFFSFFFFAFAAGQPARGAGDRMVRYLLGSHIFPYAGLVLGDIALYISK